MSKTYSFKNISKKDISVIMDGRKILIKPGKVITGTDYLSSYKGLLKLSTPPITTEQPKNISSLPNIIDIEIHEFDEQLPLSVDTGVMFSYEILSDIKKEDVNMQGKIDLTDVTFNIPIAIESEDRKNNLIACLNYLTKHFNTNIIICESDKSMKIKEFWNHEWTPYCRLIFMENKSNFFYKTKMLNAMSKLSKTPIIVSYDCDVVLTPEAYVKAAEVIRNNDAECCYPFDKPLKHITKKSLPRFIETLDISSIDHETQITNLGIPPGGCFFMNKQKFFEGGMENENMVSWGPEDQERLDRFSILGYRIKQLPYYLYHLDHIITYNSNNKNPYFPLNVQEHKKIKSMSKNDLINYINTFTWKVL